MFDIGYHRVPSHCLPYVLALFPASFYEEFKTFSLEIHHVKVKELTDSKKSDFHFR